METLQLQTNLENIQRTSYEDLIYLSHKYFSVFYNFIWSFSIKVMDGEFKTGRHLDEWCNLFQHKKLLSILSARKHSKSEIAHAYLAWRIFNMDYTYCEKWEYMSYTQDLAGEHLADTKERIRVNPIFAKEGLVDLTDAKTILYYQKGSKKFYCQPEGIMSFKRGKHPDGVICDDILKDPEVKLDVSQIIKINEIFMQQIMSMPKENGLGLKNIGTAQDEEDLFFLLEKRKQFSCHRYEAVKSFTTKEVLWPEMFPFERLIQIRDDEIGPKAFGKEYMCVPVRSSEGYFQREDLDAIINTRLKTRRLEGKVRLNENCAGGLDIGKKRHPSHLSVYGKNRRGKLVQLLSHWMDNEDYINQLDVCKRAIETFGIYRLYYDDTRAEFEGFNEIGTLPGEMTGINFTKKKKFEMAAVFEKRVKAKSIQLLDDVRQKRQILSVDNDLNAMETSEGHGDSFWSNALACYAAEEDSGARIRYIDGPQTFTDD